MAKAWKGRLPGGTDRRVEAFTESISFDHRLFREDIRASQAHARMLASVGLLTTAEADQLIEELARIRAEWERGEVPFDISLEDVHLHVESRLIDRLGDLGRKLHTARSRNDQVVTDLKLWIRDQLDALEIELTGAQRALVGLASRYPDLIVPAYTHLQRAQPVLAAHALLAYVEKFERDRQRLADCRSRVNILPLGSAACAGTSLPIDREAVARELGFERIAQNSIDVSSDRDFVLETVFVLTLIAEHLSTWAEEWILWTTTEFGFLLLPDDFCTGSSIMPQKKNPDVLELIRGRTARVIGALQTLLVLVKGLPLAYNRDLQEDKEPLFDAFDTVLACVAIHRALVERTQFNRDRIEAGIEAGYLDATTLMEALIELGTPMRSAHEVVGTLVREAMAADVPLAGLPIERLETLSPGNGARLHQVLGVQNALARFTSVGSTAPAQVAEQLRQWREKLETGPVDASGGNSQ